MTVFQLIHQNPSLAALTANYPHLRRFAEAGFETDVKLHRNDVVGLANQYQRIRVNLVSGNITKA